MSMNLADDTLLFADESTTDGDEQTTRSEAPPWELLVVDDDASVLTVTKMALREFKVGGRSTTVHVASSFKEAQDFLSEHGAVAVVVTDVVMETDQAGLDLVSWARQEPRFDAMRLVIRTGEPGSAPPERVLNELDINDYWPKTEITPHRMRTILTGLIRSYRDIVELREQQVLLQQMQAKLFQQERLKVLGELASGVVHDFRNVLTPITAYSSMLRSMPDLEPEEKAEFVDLIFEASQDAAKVVDRLQQDYLGRGNTTPNKEISLEELLKNTAALARPKVAQRAQSLGSDIELAVECPPEILVRCNSSELRQALLNLTINSADAMSGPGRILLSGQASDHEVVIKVSDTGSGMDQQTLAQCRDAFFTTKGEAGSGLGLANTANTVANHSGQLDIDSTVDVGTTITIRLPQ
ncbi:MAG: sensor histidine kinase [Bradymonadia bacterium]